MVLRILPRQNQPLEAALIKEAEQLERALAEDPRHQRLKIVRNALDQLGALPKADKATESASEFRQAISVMQAARFALEDAKHPLSLAELMAALPRYGKVPGGNKPNWNLSNQLSGNKERFTSVDWKGEKRWWFTGKPVPPE